MTNLTDFEWSAIEILAQLHELIEELPGLDYGRFHGGIVDLQDQVLALPEKRLMAKETRNAPTQ